MKFHVEWVGLEELRAELKALPDGIVKQAATIVQRTASDAERAIESAYPIGKTGNLRSHVRVVGVRGASLQQAMVRSEAPHAHLFERGTKPRHTRKGANRGVMPKAPTNEAMIPIIIRARAKMKQQLIDMVVKDARLFEVIS